MSVQDGGALARSLAHQLLDERSDLLTSAKIHLRRVAPFLQEEEHERVARSAVTQVKRAGILEQWLANPRVKEVMVNSDGAVFVEADDGLQRVGLITEHETRSIIERILIPLSRRADRLNPIADARLDDGSRVCAILPPASPLGPCLAIRRFVVTEATVERFAGDEYAGSIRALMESRTNIVVSGRASAGKTTFVNALCGLIDGKERVVTVEDTLELKIGLPNVVRLESHPTSSEGLAGVSLTQLVRTALRLRPDRIIVGEVRGAEVLDMLEALTTGHHGSLSTCHANSAQEAIARLATLVVRHHQGWTYDDALGLVQGAIGAVVHVERNHLGERRVAEIHVTERR